MTLTQDHFSLNTLQWITVSLGDAGGKPGEVGWEFDRPSFLAKQPRVLEEVSSAGFSSVMLEVLPTQTLQTYARVVADSGLSLSPGYVHIGLPEDFGLDYEGGSDAYFRWFDGIRRRAEETNYMGLDRVFLAADMAPGRPRIDTAAAVGYDADPARLDRVANIIGEAAEVLVSEGITPRCTITSAPGSRRWTSSTTSWLQFPIPCLPPDLTSVISRGRAPMSSRGSRRTPSESQICT
ncbi:hypothetical protein [Microbacterium sp. NIBRBAC000506063]|uniref:hypothetical protein n=1 Tax=Microbacterium sp. NIBRBAC000506063 TaxID=2734618 RepID=UPI001CB73522|nr:hypothetical protein [Microbacterium sp. NIBRBAC000506063]